jgi:cytochrome P450
VLGSKPYPDESDVGRLPYLRAVIMESMRLHPPSPMLMPHEAMADGAEISDYAVPCGTKVIVNLWAIMRDPELWPELTEFVPERFVGADQLDFRAKDRLEFMPFGAGRGGHSDPCLRTAHLRVEAARGDGAGRCGCQGPVWHGL